MTLPRGAAPRAKICRMKIARVATIPFVLQNHLRGQICATIAAGHEVTLISSEGPEVPLLAAIPGVRFHHIEIPRNISPLRDALALWKLFTLFRRERYDIVHSTTPKAGLLTAVAARLAGIALRLHTFTGQVWMERRGLTRFLAKLGDRVTARLNTHCYADSPSQREFIVAERVAAPEHVAVLEAGSIAGVDLARFDPAAWSNKESLRASLGIPQDLTVVTFIGRLTRDKGIEELVKAFESLRAAGADCLLVLVGPRDPDWNVLAAEVRHSVETDPFIRAIGYSQEPERYLAVTDIFCLPSYREGFGNVALEAAAMGVPAVGTDIVGLRDAIVDGETGLLVPARHADALARALGRLMADGALRRSMGEKARRRAVARFDARHVNAAVILDYQRLWRQGT